MTRTGSQTLPQGFSRHRDLIFYTFPNLSRFPEIHHGIFTRKSGASLPPFASLNVSAADGDNAGHVKQNTSKIAAFFNVPGLVFFKQVHGDRVLVQKHEPGNPAGHTPALLEGDAMVSGAPGRMIAVKVADCQPVLLYDPARKVVANIHSGWRGSIQNIIGKTIARMKTDFGCRPGDLVAGVGPSLGPCCGEFIHFRKEIPKAYWKYRTGADHFDFWAISFDQLCEAGVSEENIHISRICTACRTDQFFSYRKEGITGRFAAVIGLK